MSEERKEGEQDPRIKVTDKRMFTAEGELREDYRHLGESRGAGSAEPAADERPPEERSGERRAEAPPPPEPPRRPEPPGGEAGAAGGPGGTEESEPRLEIPTSGGLRAPEFLDLVGLLAEPVALYLGDAKLPDGSSAENLEAARFHIDLLDVLRTKTAGNLSAQENSVLEDLLYQLRMRYVHKRD